MIKQFYNTYIIGTITQGKSEPASNGCEGVLHILQTPVLELHHQMQFSIISQTLIGMVFDPSAEMQMEYSMATGDREGGASKYI